MSKTFTLPAPRVQITFTPLAFAKMLPLIMYSKDEIGWHGTVERDGNTFKITDILVYPQKVTGATVTTDQVPYQDWLMKDMPLDTFKKLRFQGHSHVNMGCTPSAVDENCKAGILESVGQDDYYLFMIWNKSLEFTGELFDATNWIKYQTKDMEISIEGVGTLENYIKGIKSLVKASTYSYYDYGSSYHNKGGYAGGGKSVTTLPATTTTTKEATTKSESKPVSKKTNSTTPSDDSDDQEWLEWFYGKRAKENKRK